MLIGRELVNNELLPHLLTVLNNRDWQLRAGTWDAMDRDPKELTCVLYFAMCAAFLEGVVGVCVFVGRVTFQVRSGRLCVCGLHW